MRRTRENLEAINDLQKNEDDRRKVYEVTQLVNSFLGAFAHPWEEWARDLKRINLEVAKATGWPIKPPDDDRDDDPRNLGELLQWVRNAMAHGNIRFLRDPTHPEDIGQVSLWNERNGWRTWGITLTVTELREFLDCFDALAGRLPDPRPRPVRHIKDKSITETRNVTISNSEDLNAALRAYGYDRDVEGFDQVVETALHDLLKERGHLVPFRPFRVTPFHREGGPTDISINHDRYFADGVLDYSDDPDDPETRESDPLP